ncbi:glycoside hydrolase family 2 protein [Agromyces soli]
MGITESATESAAVVRRPLHEGWCLSAAAGPAKIDVREVPATVPGVVHLDLMAAGLIPDPYLDDNESRLAWIGLVDWTYATTFDLAETELLEGRRHALVFDGLDTVATVTLNGIVIAEVANQHRTHRIEVADRLIAGTNELVVAFRSPVRYADAQSVKLGARPRPYPMPFEAIRKSACNFGWDWGIATFTSGIWRPVHLESWSIARIGRLRVVATPQGAGGTVVAEVEIDRADASAELEIELEAAGRNIRTTVGSGEASARLELSLDLVERWWPIGYGEQPLTEVRVRVSVDGQAVDRASRRVGFRTIRWNTRPDAEGTPFELLVNEQPVYVKGVNWIPDDAFPSRVDRSRYERRLRQAAAANLNLIRVWGGGIYESDAFYELCDELGLLAWQDFLFACAAYPEEEPLRSEVEAEARDNISRLADHPSLVLLTGNNENLWGYEDWGWKQRLDGRTWGAHYYYELFPRLIRELAPEVPYAPGSPFSPGGEHPNAEEHGTMHLWEQWNRLDWPSYREHDPRFVAEFGWQGPPTWSTLTRAVSDAPLTPESPGMIVHQKAIDGNAKLAAGLVAHYRVPDEMEAWHWATQLNQANAVGAALEWFRSRAPRNAGAVVWQLNDCWPVTSWAAIDGDGREKPLLHAIANAFASRIVTIQPRPEGLSVTMINDAAQPWRTELQLVRHGFDGSALAAHEIAVELEPRETRTALLPVELAQPGAASRELLVATAGGVRGVWFFAEPRDSELVAPELAVEIAQVDGTDEAMVAVTSDVVVRDLTVLPDRIRRDAAVDRGLVTLLPGETAMFRLTGVPGLRVEEVRRAAVLRSGNELVSR